jgi:hypothetical protein
MPRKTKRKIASKSRFWSDIFTLLLGLFTLLLTMFLISKISGKPISVCGNSLSCLGDLSGKYVEGKTSMFMGHAVSEPTYIAQDIPIPKVLGATSGGSKHIFVDLNTQTLRAYEGNSLIYTFSVATGKWHPTPTGDFRIWVKIRYAHMEGGEGADYYNLYNVPYTMFFYNDEVPKSMGFSLHGAYWHNNFGYPMSHGCVNLRPEDAAKLYDWASPATGGSTTYATDSDPGTLVTIYGVPPED